ncbi:MAG: amidase [Hyphomicrobiaceae bacterium]|nr:amidase [Hyphomicrobiaceae bacterium]
MWDKILTISNATLKSISRIASGYSKGNFTPNSVIEATLQRIKRLEPKLQAFDLILAEAAREAADLATRAIERGHAIGPFHGIPFALKDLIDVKGLITAGGTVVYADRIATATAPLVSRLLSGGGILIGKTKTVEVAYGAWGTNEVRGTPWNPWDEQIHRTPGGSSSGSAVAVASGMASCAVGTDTGGSVRIPAAWCGVSGLKVTEGRMPLEGVQPLAHTLDTPGILANSVLDTSIMFEIMDGRHPIEITESIKKQVGLYGELKRGVAGLTLGTLCELERENIHDTVLEHYDAALCRLDRLGAQIVPLELEVSSKQMRDDIGIIMSYEAYYHHGPMYEEASNKIDEHVRKRILAGRDITSAQFIEALKRRKQNQVKVLKMLAGIDAYITPTVTSTPLPISYVDQCQTPARFTRIANYLAFCAMSVPMGLIEGKGPTGLQVIAKGHNESMALRIAAAFEKEFGHLPTPPVALF